MKRLKSTPSTLSTSLPIAAGKPGAGCRWGLLLAAALMAFGGVVPSVQADWWEDNFEVHGFFTSKLYVRRSNLDFTQSAKISSWRSELNLEMDFFLYEGELNSPLTGKDETLRITGYAIVRPTYEAVYDINDTWGKDLNKANIGTRSFYNDQASHKGGQFPGQGARINDEYTIINSDSTTAFTGAPSPAFCIDDRVFLGCVGSPVLPRGSKQDRVGGPATIFQYQRLATNGLTYGIAPGAGSVGPLANSLALAGTESPLAQAFLASRHTSPGFGTDPNARGENSDAVPLNWYQPGYNASNPNTYGDSKSFDKGFDMNLRQHELSMDCFDVAHPYCWLREFYVDIEWGRTNFRIGRQQIVWGKTDAFRLQDKINPIDVGYHNIFPDLEERRIPLLALDVIHSFGDIGYFKDVSFEFAWIFDRYVGDQAGQCGEPYAFTGLCHFRADLAGHRGLNWGSRVYDQVNWKLKNTEPWARIEFRIPKPSISFSISAGWTFEDAPYVEYIRGTQWSVNNPNPAAMLFVQGFGGGFAIGDANGDGQDPWNTGFDPMAQGPDINGDGIMDPIPGSTLDLANQDLLAFWNGAVNGTCGGQIASGNNKAIGECVDPFLFFAFPWVGQEAIIRVNRIFTLGGSLDYQIPRIDTILRMEVAMDFDRKIVDSSVLKGYSSSNIFQAAIGLDRSTFIPFLNRNRTAFLSFQTFVEHIVDYNDVGSKRGMVPYENSIISTFFMQNYWRNDTIILTSFVAVLWEQQNVVTGPTLRYVHNDHLFFDFGVNLLWGQPKEFNIWDVCPTAGPASTAPQTHDAGLGCIGDPTTWTPGQWTTLYRDTERVSESAYGWARQGIADRFQRKRDEIWFGVTYQF